MERFVFGKLPFSFGDCLYFVVLFFIIKWLWIKRKSWKMEWKRNLVQLISVFSIFYFCFHIFWALNYYRTPLFEKMHLEREYSDADLLNFTEKVIEKTNEIHYQITKKVSEKVIFPYSINQAFLLNLEGYSELQNEYPFFEYSNLSVKKSLFSLPLTYMGFGGYLNPFTNEAQVNDLLPMYSFPTTTCHEMAHQMGYASESECNFIGFLASIKNKNLYFQYSGYSVALRYCLANWEVRNPRVLKALLPTIHLGILKNYKESDVFWKAYQTPIEKGFLLFYDQFLKLNQQKEGMDSYSKFVDLLVNYYKNKALR